MLVLTVVLVVAVVAGALAYNRRAWRPRQARDRPAHAGLNVEDISVPLLTLAALLLVFVLVQVFSSWARAGEEETREATATLVLFRQTDLLPPDLRARARRDVVCYARSVVGQEWPALAGDRFSNVPGYWAERVRRAGVEVARQPRYSDLGQHLVDRDADRAAARQDRLGEIRSSVPTALFLLMLLCVLVTLGIIGVITAGTVSPGVHVAIVALSALAFGGTLLLIRSLDHPYSGPTGRSPSQTRLVLAQMQRELAGDLPCTATGLPRRAPAFRPATLPVP